MSVLNFSVLKHAVVLNDTDAGGFVTGVENLKACVWAFNPQASVRLPVITMADLLLLQAKWYIPLSASAIRAPLPEYC